MTSRADEARPRAAALRRRADAQRARAARAAAAAAEAEARAGRTPPGLSKDVHSAAATAHRQAETLHLSAAAMAESLLARLDRWVSDPDTQARRPRLVGVAADVLGTPSVSVVLMAGIEGGSRLSGSDQIAQAVCEAWALTGQGPGAEAVSTGQPCAATAPEISWRWPLFAPAIAGLGINSVAAAPLGTAANRLGAVCGYYRQSALAATALTQVSHVAGALTLLLLHEGDDLGPLLARDGSQLVIHQAAGMITVQACCDIEQARHLLAARAFADGTTLAQTAAAIVRRDIQFDPIR